jgi:peptide/nickel transport system ATP-binding protein
MERSHVILDVQNLSIDINEDGSTRRLVDNLSLEVERGQTVALVGESGSGKSLTALAMLGLLPSQARVSNGAIFFDDRDLLKLPEHQMQKLRGNRLAMIFQEPGTSLNPLLPVGEQVGEAIRLHQGLDRKSTYEQVLALMEMVGIPDPRRRYRSYPHQLSGGIKQRIIIATALSCKPELLLADEPTSALDTTIQAQVVDLLSRLIRDLGMGVLLIAHDLGIVAALADRVIVLHGGRVIEEGSVREILKDPLHPYTRALLTTRPFTHDSAPATRLVSITNPSPVAGTNGDAPLSCPLASECPMARTVCHEESPGLFEIGTGRRVRCLVIESRHG